MASAQLEQGKKSTNVRTFQLRLLGAALRGGHALSPELATRIAMDLFTRPRGRRGARNLRSPFTPDARFTLNAGGHPLSAWAWGDGPLVLLLHGWNGRAVQMGAFVEPLVAAGYGVLAVDAPAHGASPGRHTNMIEWSESLVDMSRRFLGFHGIIAHSAGCVAVARALRHGLRTERLVFLSPPAAISDYSQQLVTALGLPAGFHERMWSRWESRLGFMREELDLLAGAGTQQTPLLLVHDQDDREATPDSSRRLGDRWPGARLLSTRGLGHHRIRSAPEVIRAVLDSLTAGTDGLAVDASAHRREAASPVSADCALPSGA